MPITTHLHFICLLNHSFIYIKKLSSKDYSKFATYYYIVANFKIQVLFHKLISFNPNTNISTS